MDLTGRQILITGADGYVGGNLAKTLSSAGHQLVLWVRASDQHAFNEKVMRLCNLLSIEAPLETDGLFAKLSNSITAYGGDLTSDHCMDALPTKEIAFIVHSAAATRFNIDQRLAHETNVLGTRHVIAFAERCPQLQNFLFVSSLYASGLTEGSIREAAISAKPKFANNYEHSKWQAESDLIANERIPWTIARLSTVIADDDSGLVTQQNATHNTLKLFYYGMLSLIPGKPNTPMYFITGEFATTALIAILNQPHESENNIFHLSHEVSDSIALGDFIDLVFDTFCKEEEFRKRRILRPIFSDFENFKQLSEAMSTFGQSVMVQASASISPFAEQLFSHKIVHNGALRAIMSSPPMFDSHELVAKVCHHLMSTKWRRVNHYAA